MSKPWVNLADPAKVAAAIRDGMDVADRCLLEQIEGYARTSPLAWVGTGTLAKNLGKSESAIRRGLKRLEESGWIKRVYSDDTKSTKEGLVLLKRFNEGCPVAGVPVNEITPEWCLKVREGVSVNAKGGERQRSPGVSVDAKGGLASTLRGGERQRQHNNNVLNKDSEKNTQGNITSEENSSEVIVGRLPVEVVRSIKEHIPDLIDDMQLESRRILEAAGHDAGIIESAAFGLRQDRFNGRPVDNQVELFIAKCRTLAESKALEGTPAPTFPDLATFQVSDGPHGADVSDLQRGWQFIWNAWHQKRLCEEFVRHHRRYPMAWWKQAIGKAAITAATISSMRYVVEIIEASHEAEHWHRHAADLIGKGDDATGTV